MLWRESGSRVVGKAKSRVVDESRCREHAFQSFGYNPAFIVSPFLRVSLSVVTGHFL